MLCNVLGLFVFDPDVVYCFHLFRIRCSSNRGLFTNVGPAITTLLGNLGKSNPSLGGLSTFLPVLINGMIGFIAILIFPLHWLLYYRPGNAEFAFALILPWVFVLLSLQSSFRKA